MSDQVNGSLGPDSLDSTTVVTAQQYAQVYELRQRRERGRVSGGGRGLHSYKQKDHGLMSQHDIILTVLDNRRRVCLEIPAHGSD